MKSKLKVNNPVSAGTRHKVSLCKLESSLQPYKKLIKGKISSGGRNNTGRITMRRLGGGHKQCYRMVDTLGKYGEFSDSKYLSTEYDPTRTANINRYYTKKFNTFYVLGSEEISDIIQGSKVIENNNFKAGNVLPLKNIPVGFEIYNIQNHKSNKKTNFCKSAGCKSILLKLQDGKALVKLPSKAQLLLD
jgi:large subunit ribosomal protein L2